MKLYGYWRSTTSFRVRAALNLKNAQYEICPVDLVAGEQCDARYGALNPGKGVPSLVLDDGEVLTQSLAIMDYLDAVYPSPRLIPEEPLKRVRVLAAAHTVAMDVHPVNNMRVIGQLKSRFDATSEQTRDWMIYWILQGFEALERLLVDEAEFSFGKAPDLADLCLVAQVYNARRWSVDMAPFPKIRRVAAACLDVPEIVAAYPDYQPDAKVTA